MTPHAAPPRIALFLKAPVPGRVKTRLAATLGDATACAVYRALVERQVAALPHTWDAEVHVDPPGLAGLCRAWLGPRFTYVGQSGHGLGERLEHAARRAFTHDTAPWIVIGGDCVGLDEVVFREAAEALRDGADVVLGPAEDGGYHLLGLRAFHPEVFRDIPWSTDRTAAVTLRRAHDAGLRAARVRELPDIDDAEALERHAPAWRTWIEELTGAPTAASGRTPPSPTA